jgi:pyridoxal phosphate enzyme (YggS family)
VSISSALEQVRRRLQAACVASQRAPEQVKLIAVSKTCPAAAIREAYAAGQRDFGENYVQELVQKAEELRDLTDLRWHLIGHLQRNKARHVAPLVTLLHTVDTAELAGELAKRASAQPGVARDPLQVLVEVSIAGEVQKHGAPAGELAAALPTGASTETVPASPAWSGYTNVS